jgi:hypothetical protein
MVPEIRSRSQLREPVEFGIKKAPGLDLRLATPAEYGVRMDFVPLVPRKGIVQESLNPLGGQVCFRRLLCHVVDSS